MCLSYKLSVLFPNIWEGDDLYKERLSIYTPISQTENFDLEELFQTVEMVGFLFIILFGQKKMMAIKLKNVQIFEGCFEL